MLHLQVNVYQLIKYKVICLFWANEKLLYIVQFEQLICWSAIFVSLFAKADWDKPGMVDPNSYQQVKYREV